MRIFLLVTAAVFSIYGLGFVFFTETFCSYVTDTFPTTTSGMIDMRATYGGMSIGIGVLFYLFAKAPQFFSIGTKAIVLIVGGMAFGRIVGIVLDGAPNTIMYIYLLLEIVVVAIGLMLLSKARSAQHSK